MSIWVFTKRLAGAALIGAVLALGLAGAADRALAQGQDQIQAPRPGTGQAPSPGPGQGQGQGEEVEGTVYEHWKVICPKEQGAGQPCQMYQNVVAKDSGQPLLQVIVGFLDGVEQPVAVMSLPLGIYLPKGVSMQVDEGQVYEMSVEVCAPNGCRLRFSFDDALLTAVKAGARAQVTFYDVRQRPVRIPVSLKGFSAAYAALRKS